MSRVQDRIGIGNGVKKIFGGKLVDTLLYTTERTPEEKMRRAELISCWVDKGPLISRRGIASCWYRIDGILIV